MFQMSYLVSLYNP